MIDIEQVEEFLWKFFGEHHFVRVIEPDGTGTDNVFSIQDIGPALADFLHEQGVDIDWTDRSRFGTRLSPHGYGGPYEGASPYGKV